MPGDKPPVNPTILPTNLDDLLAEVESTARPLGDTPAPAPSTAAPKALPTLAPVPIGELVSEAMERGADKDFERREQWEAPAVEAFESSDAVRAPPSLGPFQLRRGPSAGQIVLFAVLVIPPLVLFGVLLVSVLLSWAS